MATTTIEISELASHLKEIVSLAATGTEVIVTENNVPFARLQPLPPNRPRVLGLHPGAIETTEDFDAPLPDEFWLGSP